MGVMTNGDHIRGLAGCQTRVSRCDCRRRVNPSGGVMAGRRRSLPDPGPHHGGPGRPRSTTARRCRRPAPRPGRPRSAPRSLTELPLPSSPRPHSRDGPLRQLRRWRQLTMHVPPQIRADEADPDAAQQRSPDGGGPAGPPDRGRARPRTGTRAARRAAQRPEHIVRQLLDERRVLAAVEPQHDPGSVRRSGQCCRFRPLELPAWRVEDPWWPRLVGWPTPSRPRSGCVARTRRPAATCRPSWSTRCSNAPSSAPSRTASGRATATSPTPRSPGCWLTGGAS
jgi:hypothetical protein